jgi:methylmalonyl-CoA mutase cobalamin-binding subunit
VKSDTVRLTYRGGVRGISMLAEMLEEQGVSVRYTPARETRDMSEAAAIVVVVLSATGHIHDISMAVQRFRQQFGSDAQIEGVPEPKQSVEERLAAVDQLLADGKITPEEHAQHRTRILNEL